jgi:peroxiredoxin
VRKNIAVLVLIVLLAAVAVYQHITVSASKAADDEMNEPAVEQKLKPAPAFKLTSLDGRTYEVGGAREKPLVLNFWASWCTPCHDEAPDLKKVYGKYEGKVDFYAVNITRNDTKEKAEEFVKKYGLTFPVLLDLDAQVSEMYRVIFVPTSFIVDRQGTIKEVVHLLTPEQWDQKLQNVLK